MAQPYLVINQMKSYSRNTGRPYTKITMIGIKDQVEYETYIEEGMRNYRHWADIVSRPNDVFVVNNIRISDVKDKLVDADSRPVIELSANTENQHLILDPITEFWEQENRRGGTTFNDLFGDDK